MIRTMSRPTSLTRRPMSASAVATMPGRARGTALAVHRVGLLDQAAIVLRQADHLRILAAGGKSAYQPLQQPGPERVEPLDPSHVDVDAFDQAVAVDQPLDQRLEVAGMLGRPRSAGGERQALAGELAFDQGAAQKVMLHRRISRGTQTARPLRCPPTMLTIGLNCGGFRFSQDGNDIPFVLESARSKAGRSPAPSRSAAARRPRRKWWSRDHRRSGHGAGANACPIRAMARRSRASSPP